MFPKIRLLAEQENALLIPRVAVIRKEGEDLVFVVRDNLAHLQKVDLGLEEGNVVQILDGLKEGDQVVISGQTGLHGGDPVIVK
jgi:multidrug efflux pump subunit AcrA (membrane-fusion protein)